MMNDDGACDKLGGTNDDDDDGACDKLGGTMMVMMTMIVRQRFKLGGTTIRMIMMQ